MATISATKLRCHPDLTACPETGSGCRLRSLHVGFFGGSLPPQALPELMALAPLSFPRALGQRYGLGQMWGGAVPSLQGSICAHPGRGTGRGQGQGLGT